MSMGAVLHQTGTARASGLGGLARRMPWTAALCCVGALGMSAPGFASFASKSLIISAAGEAHLDVAYFVLVATATGVFFAAGLRVTWLAFFAAPAPEVEERLRQVDEAPLNMRLAMLGTAALVVGVGLAPQHLYALLPALPDDYHLFTTSHVLPKLQLLAFAGLAFALLTRAGVLARPARTTHLDVDWLWRRALPAVGLPLLRGIVGAWNGLLAGARGLALPMLEYGFRYHGRTGLFGRTWPTGSMALWMAVLLGGALILYYL
jgi:multicomponent Na+:H+ antiporter subunit D